MITKTARKGEQIEMVSLDQLVPEDHLLRKIDENIDFSFIYDLVEEKYSPDNGRPSIDPVTLIKIPIIQYMFGIKSMRQTIKEIEDNGQQGIMTSSSRMRSMQIERPTAKSL